MLALECASSPPAASSKRANFEVARGEIFGIAGVSGNGQAQLADALVRPARRPARGEIRVGGRAVAATPRAFIARRCGARAGGPRRGGRHRRSRDLGERDLRALPRAARSRAAAGCSVARPRRRRSAIVEQFDVRCSGLDAPARSMSGGNIQKLILGRALVSEPAVIVANQPTWGLDVGAVSYIHSQLLAARERGAAIVLISEDLDELFAIADRIAVMFHGVCPTRATLDASREIGLAMAGGGERRGAHA